jgi:hypothetical protein
MTTDSRSALYGVILGSIISLICSFSVQIYVDSVQDRRSAKADRAQHIERLSIASTNILTSEMAYASNVMNLLIQVQTHGVPDANAMMPDLASVAEMQTVAALYLPEAEPETKQIGQDYSDFCRSFIAAVLEAARNYRPGDPLPALKIDQQLVPRTQTHVNALQKKLVELARRNRA